MSETPWYQELFGEDYLRMWGPRLTPERAARELEGIVNLLALPPGSRILDLCCGHGRHAIPLAQQGYEVTGQDLSAVFLEHARAEAEAQGVPVRWVHGDMREIPFEDEFDAVINIFTSFGYLGSDDEDQKVLHHVHKALKPGGRFLMENNHRDIILRAYRPHTITRHEDGLIDLHESRFDLLTSRNDTRVTMILPDGTRKEYHFSVRMYTLTELARMLATAGLSVQAYYGSLDGSELTLDSRRLVIISQK